MAGEPRRMAAKLLVASMLLAGALPACAQQALGVDVRASDDADGTRIARTGLSLDYRHADAGHYAGLHLQQARFSPGAGGDFERNSVYWRFAGGATGHDDWSWAGMLGSDGHTWLGNANLVRNGAHRFEAFIDRSEIETPVALRQRKAATFAGAAVDLPWQAKDTRDTTVLLGGVQVFDDGNRRTHVRATQIHVLDEARGLSLQLRLRYARDSAPHSLDYYSPRWSARALPVLQWRRFRGGWQYRVAAGIGRQADADAGWRGARLLEAGVTSPTTRRWAVDAALVHTNEPSASGLGGYRYTQVKLSVMRSF